MIPRRLNLRQRLDRYPPILIRLLTTRRTGGKVWVPTDRQLADACGLTMAEFKHVSYSTSWRGITDGVKDAYLKGCDVDLEKRRCFRRLEWMRKNGTFRHLKSSPQWEQYKEMLDLFSEASP